MQHAARPLSRRLAGIALVTGLALALAASFSTRASAASKPDCGLRAQSGRIVALNLFRSRMNATRAAFFREHRSARARHRFLVRQQRGLAALHRAVTRCSTPDGPVADSGPDPQPPPCSPSLFSAPFTEMNEGTTNSTLPLRPNGPIRAVMLFVDFPDLHASEPTSYQYNRLVPRAREWYVEASYGHVSLDVTPLDHWVRMPRDFASYGLRDGITWQEHHDYIADAVAAADPEVDFSQYQVVYVVAPKNTGIERSPAFQAYPGSGIQADGTEIRYGATFFDDTRYDARYAANVLIHETGHILGLPDLYDVPNPVYWSLFRYAGGWDMMSWNDPGAHFLAWEKWKLGWLDPSQLTCLDSPGEVTTTITPIERAGGLKAVVVPTGISTAYVIEARRRIGEDDHLCSSGVLVYKVDASLRSGFGPVQVSPAQKDTNSSLRDMCGPLYNAPYDKAKGKVAHFEDASAGIAMDVLSSDTRGYRVHVTRTSLSPQWAFYSPMGFGTGGGAIQEGSSAPSLLQPSSFPFGTGWDLSGPPNAD